MSNTLAPGGKIFTFFMYPILPMNQVRDSARGTRRKAHTLAQKNNTALLAATALLPPCYHRHRAAATAVAAAFAAAALLPPPPS
jgi:hypothetical protein